MTKALDGFIQQMSAPPIRMTWTCPQDGGQLIGQCAGMLISIWPRKVEIEAQLPADMPTIAQQNAQLLRRILCDMRSGVWPGAAEWLAGELWNASQIRSGSYAAPCGDVCFVWDANRERAMLAIGR